MIQQLRRTISTCAKANNTPERKLTHWCNADQWRRHACIQPLCSLVPVFLFFSRRLQPQMVGIRSGYRNLGQTYPDHALAGSSFPHDIKSARVDTLLGGLETDLDQVKGVAWTRVRNGEQSDQRAEMQTTHDGENPSNTPSNQRPKAR